MIERYIAPTVGQYALRSIRTEHLNDLYTALTSSGGQHGGGLAAKTVHEVHLIVRSALTQTTEQGLTRSNVALRTQRPRPHARPRRGPETWTANELTMFLGTAGGHRLYPALHLTATTGMRRGEIAGLRWGDWNAASHQLSISRTRQALAGRSPSSPPRHAPADAASNWTPTPNTSSNDGATANATTGTASGRATRCSPTLTAMHCILNRSASCSPGSSCVPVCLTSDSMIYAIPTPACLSPPAFQSRSCQNDSATPTRRSRSTPTNTCSRA